MKFLILDNAQESAGALKQLLEEKSFRAEVFSSFAAAKGRFKGDFDVFIADLMLPDIQGAPLLERLLEETDPKIRFLFVSAVFSEKQINEILPESLKDRSFFLKKPVDQTALEEKIEKIRRSLKSRDGNSASDAALPFQLQHPDFLSNGSNILKERSGAREADSRFLIPVLIDLNRENFSGLLIAESEDEELARIAFQGGTVVQMTSKDTESLFGVLLVEHGFSLQQEIKDVLAHQQKDNKQIGAKLIEKGLLSPHSARLILKEQIKIRLSALISEGRLIALRAGGAEKPLGTEKDGNEMSDFSARDILDWAVDCIQTKFSAAYWEEFYEQRKGLWIRPLKAVPDDFLKNKAFAAQYNKLFLALKEDLRLEEALKESGMEKRAFLETAFFSALSKSLSFLPAGGGSCSADDPAETAFGGGGGGGGGKKNSETVQKLAEAFLRREPRNLFETLHLPWKAPVSEVKKHYKMIASRFHPDKLPEDAAGGLKDMCSRVLQQAQEANNILSDEKKRREYIEEKESKNFTDIVSVYQQGRELLGRKSFKEALDLFRSIKNSSFCPKDIILYMLWAEIQMSPDRLQDPTKAGEIREKISRSPIELRASSLFWFVNGLFYARTGQYEKAGNLFKKVIAIDKRFTEASRELLKLKKEIKRRLAQSKKPSLIQRLFPMKQDPVKKSA